ncbi:MAG: riboflavin synthase [Actinomycetota bacterium]
MFTGIVTELGTVTNMERMDGFTRFGINAPETTADAGIGDSIAVNGVCLTAISIDDGGFSVDVVDESLDRSSLGGLAPGGRVNLERPMPAHGRFDGHIVQGHVDGVGRVVSRTAEGEAARFRISLPASLSRYIVEKGSIAVDGTSLTITAVSELDADDAWFEIAVIPHTLEATVFGITEAGSEVNLEVDVIAKYLERMAGSGR